MFGMIYVAGVAAGIGYDFSAEVLGDAALLYYLLYAFFMLFLQACATIAILGRGGVALASPRRWRIASLFGIGVMAGLGIFLGLLVLVLPGLFLAGRWYLAAPILFGEDVSASEAMSRSWERTEQYWLGIAIVVLLGFVWQAAPLAGALYLSPDIDNIEWTTSVAMNAVSHAGWMFGVAAAATAYLLLGGPGRRALEIFG